MSVTIRTKSRPWKDREVSEEEATDLRRMGLLAEDEPADKSAPKKAARSRAPRKKATAKAATTTADGSATDTTKEG